MAEFQGLLSKMAVALPEDGAVANYQMVLDQQHIAMQPFIGQTIQLSFEGKIHCQACNRLTKKVIAVVFAFLVRRIWLSVICA